MSDKEIYDRYGYDDDYEEISWLEVLAVDVLCFISDHWRAIGVASVILIASAITYYLAY
jgi:hypothetical protein